MRVSSGILIIGYGHHVENKILPAIRILNIPLLGIISLNNNVPRNISHFKSLREIKNFLKPSHVFIATNPIRHLDLILGSNINY